MSRVKIYISVKVSVIKIVFCSFSCCVYFQVEVASVPGRHQQEVEVHHMSSRVSWVELYRQEVEAHHISNRELWVEMLQDPRPSLKGHD